MRISQRFASALFGALALCPLAAWGQAGGDAGRNVGVVTTLAGQATVARAALASPVPLRFKDDVFLRDRAAGTIVWAADEVVYAPEVAVTGVQVDEIAGFMEELD